MNTPRLNWIMEPGRIIARAAVVPAADESDALFFVIVAERIDIDPRGAFASREPRTVYRVDSTDSPLLELGRPPGPFPGLLAAVEWAERRHAFLVGRAEKAAGGA